MSCTNLASFLQTEIDIIKENIDTHKYLRGIEDEQNAIADFVAKYGWIMRTYYCKFICPNSGTCDIRDKNN